MEFKIIGAPSSQWGNTYQKKIRKLCGGSFENINLQSKQQTSYHILESRSMAFSIMRLYYVLKLEYFLPSLKNGEGIQRKKIQL